MKKLAMLFCTLTMALPLLISNLALARGQNGMPNPDWAMPPSFPANYTHSTERAFTSNYQVLPCGTNSVARHLCPVDGVIRDVRIVPSLSGKPCIKDRTWGWNHLGIWVSQGCHATFRARFIDQR